MNLELENNPTNTSLNEIADPATSQIEQGLQQGLTFCAEQRWAEAKACFEAVIAEDPAHKIAWNNLGNVLDDLGDVAGAYQAFERALALDPDYESPKKNLAIVAYKDGTQLYAAGDLQGALEAFQTAAGQGQNLADYDHSYLQLLLETCEHTQVTAHAAAMHERTQASEYYYPHPYPLLAAVDDPAWHMLAAKRHVTRLCKDAGVSVTRPATSFVPSKRERIRVAYLSCDWHQHPVPQQLLASIEAHDRAKFEVFGVATDGAADTTPWRQRIERAFDEFLVLGDLSDIDIAERLSSLEIDIAIDLSLYMQGGRPLILASRPCPVQIAFLGYTGTSGAPWIDYIIADEVTIPQHLEQFYSEKIIRLSDSFMPDNDQRPPMRAIDNLAVGRMQQGLPIEAFVFCAFSNPYKITPVMLACWFRLLHAVPNSVLWLQANNDVTKRHIEAAALAAGLDITRVIFAERMDSFDAHLQRYQLADLFLDTCPYNAHVTAADSLWAGLPVLTLQGESFASRVASSILSALDLPELMTTNLAGYEARALELASDAGQLKALRAKLEESKMDGKYFNQMHYVRGLEAQYQKIFKQSQRVVVVSLFGGLGNQLFQYATARALAETTNAKIVFNLSWFEQGQAAAGLTHLTYGLAPFKLEVSVMEGSNAECEVFNEARFQFNPDLLALTPPVWLSGYWQSQKYFQQYADLIFREIGMRREMSDLATELLKKIEADDGAIALHIRRGDYASNPDVAKFHGMCSMEYYQAGLAIASRNLKNPHCYVFSNDLTWAREHFKADMPITVVDVNDGASPHEDLWLMAACKNFVIANSTFSWWGAWLGRDVQKIVVAPRQWFLAQDVDTTDLCPEEWILI